MQSAITDLAGLRYWAHPGVDMHFVTHPESIEEVERLAGPGRVEWMRPPISRDFLMPRTRRDAREALDVPRARAPRPRLRRRLGGRRPRGRDRAGARRRETRSWSASPAATRSAREKLEQRFARQRAGADPRLHRADERLDGGGRRDGPRDRRADRARGPHPRLPGRLLRLLGRPPARQQRRLRALRPRRGGALRRTSSSRSCATSPASAARPTPRSPRCPRSPRGRSRCGRGCKPAAGLAGAHRAGRRGGRRLVAVAGGAGALRWSRPESPLQGGLRSRSRAASTSAPTTTAAGDSSAKKRQPRAVGAEARRASSRSLIAGRCASRRWPRALSAHAGPALAPVVPAVGRGLGVVPAPGGRSTASR